MPDPTAPICPQCNERERCYDNEPGSEGYYTYCSECGQIHADAPWCHHQDCSRIGGGRAEFTGDFTADGQPLYLCEQQHFGPMTQIQYRAHAGVTHGEQDAHDKLAGRNSTRVEAWLEALGADVTHPHPAPRAYAQGYVASALHTLDNPEQQR